MGRISFSKSLHERLTGSCSKFQTFKPFFDNSCIPLLKQPFCREIIISPGEGGILFYLCPSVQDIFRRIFLSHYWWQKSDIWSQPSYRYPISWEAFLDPSDSYADFVDFYTHWTYILYMPIFSRIFLSNYWWQKSDIWSQALYRYPISWEAFFDPSDSYFLFAEERGYHKWALAHSSSCLSMSIWGYWLKADSQKIRNKCIVVLI